MRKDIFLFGFRPFCWLLRRVLFRRKAPTNRSASLPSSARTVTAPLPGRSIRNAMTGPLPNGMTRPGEIGECPPTTPKKYPTRISFADGSTRTAPRPNSNGIPAPQTGKNSHRGTVITTTPPTARRRHHRPNHEAEQHDTRRATRSRVGRTGSSDHLEAPVRRMP